MSSEATNQGVEGVVSPGIVPVKEKRFQGLPLSVIIILLIFAFLAGLLVAGLYFQSELQKMNAFNTSIKQ